MFVTVVAMALLPAVFPIFWTTYELANIAHLFINSKVKIKLKNFGIKEEDKSKRKAK